MAQITASSLFGASAPVPMAVSPYGVGLGMESQSAPVAVMPPQAGTSFGPAGMPQLLSFTTFDFWQSSSFGLILLILLVAYFDIRLLNR